MGLTLDQILTIPDKDTIRTNLLRALQGVGFTQRTTGYAPGTVFGQGVPTLETTVIIKVMTPGQLGTAQVQVSTDNGVTFGSTVTIPSNGQLALSGTGVTLVFANGPAGVTESFHSGNVFQIGLTRSGFAPTAWQPGSTPLTLLETDAQLSEDVYSLVKIIAAGGLLDYAQDDWLDLLGENFYNLPRLQGSTARGQLLLTDAGGAGPFTFTAGQLWAVSNAGLLYTNEGPFTLAHSSTATPIFKAEQTGVRYNAANNTVQTLSTPIAGVTVNNPDPGSGTWLVTQGADVESNDNYRSRCRARWSTLGTGSTAEVYDLWARTASAEVNRTTVRPSGVVPGEVDVYLAGPSGPVSSQAVTDANTYIQPRVALTNTALVASAAAHPITVTATVYVRAGFETQAAIDCAANLDAMIAALPVGGTLYWSNIVEQLSLPNGVRNVSVSVPSTDVTLGATEVATLTQNLTFTTV